MDQANVIELSGRSTVENSFHVVGIGASAGGLKTMEDFFRNVPDDIGMSFVVVQHLSPKYKSVMPELLARHTGLTVQHAEDGARVEPGIVYLIPPGKNLTIKNGVLLLSEQPRSRGVNLPIDIFFRSLAEDLGDRTIGIILSGTGTDGTLGLREIKGAGGMVMVQRPTSAQFDGMPRSAIATRMVDFVLEADEMPAKLSQYASYPTLSRNDQEPPEETSIYRLFGLLEGHTGIDFSGYRRSTFLRRLDKRMQMNQLQTFEEYLDYVDRHPGEIEKLYQDVLIGVTRFFRDTDHWQLLREQVVPALWRRHVEESANSERSEMRIWSVGCSTGEEAYSLAIVFHEVAVRLGIEPNFKVFATDVDKEAIRVASVGAYPESITADIPPELLNPHFHRKSDRYVVNDTIRRKVIFSLHDVTRNPPFNRIDLVSCRNMVIYLTTEVQKNVISNFCFALREGGYLWMGPSESLGEFDVFFDPLSHRSKLFRYEGGAKPTIVQMRLRSTQTPHRQLPMAGRATSGGYSSMERAIFREVMARYGPATAIVTDTHSVLMTFGAIQDYLQLPPGKVTFDLLSMAGGTLGALLGTAMHKARQTRELVEYRAVRLGSMDDGKLINLKVAPLPKDGRNEQLYAIVIEETPHTPVTVLSSSERAFGDEAQSHLLDLERELQYTKENLQATIEELETANEELQATNEELLASNEELQSTNEELQSVNEELVTVNTEHQLKIEELTQSGNDFDNLLVLAEIHTIFLDRELRVRKFSQGDGPFNLVESDIGRSIRDFAMELEFPNFLRVVDEVRKTLAPHDGIYASQGERWYRVKVVPYRTREDQIRGVVVTMVDVSERYLLQQRVLGFEQAAEQASPDDGRTP